LVKQWPLAKRQSWQFAGGSNSYFRKPFKAVLKAELKPKLKSKPKYRKIQPSTHKTETIITGFNFFMHRP